MTHTKESILSLINKSDKAVYRGLVCLYERQTADEQNAETTNHRNGVGFNGTAAKFATSLAKQIIKWNETPANERRYNYPLSRTQLEAGRKIIRKYCGQLARVANEKEAEREEHEIAAAESRAEMEAEYAALRYAESRAEMAYYSDGYGYID